jgi:hypothetical protein
VTRSGALAGVNLAPVPANTPQPVLQFTNLNIQIVNSQFSDLVGTPYTMIFNDSSVEFINTTFTSNTGARGSHPKTLMNTHISYATCWSNQCYMQQLQQPHRDNTP